MAKFSNTQLVATDGLAHLRNNLVLVKMVNRDYDTYFKSKKEKIGTSILIKLPNAYTSTEGKVVTNLQEVEQETVKLELKRRHVAVAIDVEDENFRLDSWSYSIIEPAMIELANAIESEGLALAKLVANTTGSFEKGLTKKSVSNAKTILDNEAVPAGMRHFIVAPETEASIVESISTLFNDSKEVSRQYRTRDVGGLYGFQSASFSQNVYAHTVGSAVADPIVIDGANQSGDTLKVGGVIGDLNEGDTFTIAGVYAVNPKSRTKLNYLRKFVVLPGSTKTSLKIFPSISVGGSQPTVNALPADGADLEFMGTAGQVVRYNLAFHRDAIIFVNVATTLNDKGTESYTATDDDLGLAVRVTKDYEFTDDEQKIRFDCHYGWLLARPNFAVKMIDKAELLEE